MSVLEGERRSYEVSKAWRDFGSAVRAQLESIEDEGKIERYKEQLRKIFGDRFMQEREEEQEKTKNQVERNEAVKNSIKGLFKRLDDVDRYVNAHSDIKQAA